jgi:hypothetical protein
MANVLSKMLILEPETYKKLQQNVTQEKNLSYLDKLMNKILRNSKLNTNKKWYLYRQQLLKYAMLRRNMTTNPRNMQKKQLILYQK